MKDSNGVSVRIRILAFKLAKGIITKFPLVQ